MNTWYSKQIEVPKNHNPDHIFLARDHMYIDEKSNKQVIVKQFQYGPLPQANIHAYEIIPADFPRYFYADLDLYSHIKQRDGKHDINPLFHTTSTADMVQEALALVDHILLSEFKIKPSITPPIILIVPNEQSKKSAHIIWPNIILENVTTTKYFVQIIKQHIERLPDSILASTLDRSVYRANQNFRLAGQSKWGKDDSYALVPTDPTLRPEHCLVGCYKTVVISPLPKLKEKALAHARVKEKESFPAVFDIESLKQKHLHIPVPNNLLNLSPQEYVELIPNSNEHPQSYHVWWSIGQALKNIDASLLDTWIAWSNKASIIYPDEENQCAIVWQKMMLASPFQGNQVGVSFLREMAGFKCPIPLDEMFDILLDPSINITIEKYESRYCRPYGFDIYDLIISQAAMGSGKTHQILQLLQKYPELYKRILIISPRCTYSKEKVAEFKSTCPDFKNYQDKDVKESEYWLYDFDKLAIQVESLHRLRGINIDSRYDLVILDEIESILNQFSSETNKRLDESFSAFLDIIHFSKKVIMADAFISNRTVHFAKNFVKNADGTPKKQLRETNTHNPNSHITTNIIGLALNPTQPEPMRRHFIEHIMASLKNDKKMLVACSSKKFKDDIVKAIKQDLLEECNILSYDGDADDSLAEGLENVREVWADPNIRIVLTTTKITVGINFDVPDVFDTIYMYGSNSCLARDLIQTHFRVRHIKEPNIYVALNCCHGPDRPSHGFSLREVLDFHKCVSEAVNANTSSLKVLIYTLVSAFNTLEKQLGYDGYDKIMLHLLKCVGYKIAWQLPPLGPVTKKEKIQEILSSDHSTFVSMVNTRTHVVEQYVDLIKAGKASSVQKTTVAAYYFYKNVIKDATQSDYLDSPSLSIPLCSDLFTEYSSNKTVKTHLDNLVAESSILKKAKTVDNFINSSRYNVHETKQHALKLEHVFKVCAVLGLKHSFDIKTQIKDKQLEQFKQYLLDNPLCTKLFGLSNEQQKPRQCITAISNIFRYWNGLALKVVDSHSLIQGTRKAANKDYVCQLVCKHDLINQFIAELKSKSPFEENMFDEEDDE